MRPAVALVTPNYEIDSREHQTCTRIYRPDNSYPTHVLLVRKSSLSLLVGFTSLTETPFAHKNLLASVLVSSNRLIWSNSLHNFRVKSPTIARIRIVELTKLRLARIGLAYSLHKQPSFYTIGEDTQKVCFQAFDTFCFLLSLLIRNFRGEVWGKVKII